MGGIKGFEDPIIKDMIRFKTLSIFFSLEMAQRKSQNNQAEKIEIFLALRNFLQVK